MIPNMGNVLNLMLVLYVCLVPLKALGILALGTLAVWHHSFPPAPQLYFGDFGCMVEKAVGTRVLEMCFPGTVFDSNMSPLQAHANVFLRPASRGRPLSSGMW